MSKRSIPPGGGFIIGAMLGVLIYGILGLVGFVASFWMV